MASCFQSDQNFLTIHGIGYWVNVGQVMRRVGGWEGDGWSSGRHLQIDMKLEAALFLISAYTIFPNCFIYNTTAVS